MKKFLTAAGLAAFAGAAMAQAPTAIDLGVVSDTSATYSVPDVTTNFNSSLGTILWYRFALNEATSASTIFLDIDTTPQTVGGVNSDLELGVYDSLGNLIASDDDDWVSLHPSVTFGQTTPTRTMTFGSLTAPLAANGRDGNLAPGIYYVAVGAYNVTFGTTNWTVTSNSANSSWQGALNFRTNASAVPEPATVAVLGIGAAALLRRRRK